MKTVWIPAHPKENLQLWRARGSGPLFTASLREAMQFATREECEDWVRVHHYPPFVVRGYEVEAK